MREIGMRVAGCLREKFGQIMTNSVTGCHLGDTANTILGKMTLGRFRYMPAIDGGGMVGVISIGDVVEARIFEVE